MGLFPSQIYFFGVIGQTQLVGCASPTQTLGLQIFSLVVFSPVPAAISITLAVVIYVTFFHSLPFSNAALESMGKLRTLFLTLINRISAFTKYFLPEKRRK
jgi:hypothetical protein